MKDNLIAFPDRKAVVTNKNKKDSQDNLIRVDFLAIRQSNHTAQELDAMRRAFDAACAGFQLEKAELPELNKIGV